MKITSKLVLGIIIILALGFMISCENQTYPTENSQISARESLYRIAGCVQPPDGMVAWWTGDGTTEDFIGGNDGGSLMNGAGYIAGMVSQGFALDGSDDYVAIPYDPSLDIPGSMTIDAWIYSNGSNGNIVSKEKTGGVPLDVNYNMHILSNKVFFAITFENHSSALYSPAPSASPPGAIASGDGGGVYLWGATPITTGYHHVGATYNNDTKRMAIYLDGVLDGETFWVGATAPRTNSSGVNIGRRHSTYGPLYFNGIIDEVEIFNRELDASEILAIYDAGSAGKCKTNTIEVEIDIKPGSDPNPVNCQDNDDKGVIPVAILTTDVFDALTVDHTTVSFGIGGAEEIHDFKKTDEAKRHEEDVDGDGDVDLVFHFLANDTGIECGHTEVGLSGETYSGEIIIGSDFIVTVP